MLQCTAPAGSGGGIIVVTVDGRNSTPAVFDYPPPRIVRLSKIVADADTGTRIVIVGRDLGLRGGSWDPIIRTGLSASWIHFIASHMVKFAVVSDESDLASVHCCDL
jgi:hypothetical protein